jgi:hypothetical protein
VHSCAFHRLDTSESVSLCVVGFVFLKCAMAISVCSVLSRFVRSASVRSAFLYVSIVRGDLALRSRCKTSA